MTTPSLRELIAMAQSPVKHPSGGLTNEALSARELIRSRFTPEVTATVLTALEAAARGDTSQTCSPGNEGIVVYAMDALKALGESAAPREVFSPYEQAILHLAHFDLQYGRLQNAVDSLLRSRRAHTANTESVLTEKLDALLKVAAESTPRWSKPPTKENSLVIGLLHNALAFKSYPRGSEAQVRCMEEAAQDIEHLLKVIGGKSS